MAASKRVNMLILILALTSPTTTVLGAGPDVIVGDLTDVAFWGASGGESAFSVGTTSCNIGDQELKWISNTSEHPVIAQNLYRLRDGRFQQIGMSWVKHGFFALAEDLCQLCHDPNNSQRLGVGCSDPYSASLNGTQQRLGPRGQINAFTGAYPFPLNPAPAPPANPVTSRRIRVKDTDLLPQFNPAAEYFVEGQYVTADDARFGNGNNNVSYRRAFIGFQDGAPILRLSAADPTKQKEPAIFAWRALDPEVRLFPVDVPSEGRFIFGVRSTQLPTGQTHFEFAVYNQTSDRAAGSLTIHFDEEVSVEGVGFTDIHHHSGEPFKDDDWTAAIEARSVSWSTKPFSEDHNANAIRWGTLYNFWLDANKPAKRAEIAFFKPGEPTLVEVNLATGPPQAASLVRRNWLLGDQSVDLGTISKSTPRTNACRVTLLRGTHKKLRAVNSSHVQVKPAVQPAGGDGWQVDLSFDPTLPNGYFESVLTFESEEPTDQSFRVRVYGNIAEQ